MLKEKEELDYYYSSHKLMTYDPLYAFIIGARSIGKTFDILKRAISRFIKYREEFIYLRRYPKELRKVYKLLKPLIKKNVFDGHLLEVKGRKFFVDGMEAGCAIELSKQVTEKSVPYDNVTSIIFDEFILPKKSNYKYIPDEITNFLELYTTVARIGTDHPEVRTFFIANAMSYSNPYFDYWNIRPNSDSRYTRYGDMVIDNAESSVAMLENQQKSRFYGIIKGTDYEKYSMRNEVLEKQEDNFIKKKKGKVEYQFAIAYKNKKYGVWRDYENWKYYVSYDINKQFKRVYAMTLESMEPNTYLLKKVKNDGLYKPFIEHYRMGRVYYESKDVMTDLVDIMRRTLY